MLDRFLQRALAACPAEGRAFVEQALGPLRAYDAANGSALLGTLRVYFANEGSVERTAAVLALHRHTVHYRLGRITDLTGRDPATTHGRLELHLALLLDDLLAAQPLATAPAPPSPPPTRVLPDCRNGARTA